MFAGMFSVDEFIAATIRKTFEDGGELAAVVELRRLFPGIANNENARICVRAIAGWTPIPPVLPRKRKGLTKPPSS